MNPRFSIETLGSTHDRSQFSCGSEALDRYFKTLASQDVKRRISNCFVALSDGGAVAGFYTLAATSLPTAELPEALAKRLPRYGLAPAGLIGRLAVDAKFRGLGLGSTLVMDALARAARSEPAIFALIVDAKDAAARAFYLNLGFLGLASKPNALYLPIETALRALALK